MSEEINESETAKMNDEKNVYPLYPTLAPDAAQEAQALMDGFKLELEKLCSETLGRLYCDVTAYIESDHWTNYRTDLLAGLCNYGNRKIQASYDFAKIRKAIFTEFRAEIIDDLNQDMIKEIEDLKQQISNMRKLENGRF